MKNEWKEFFEDLSIEIRESYAEQQRIGKRIAKELASMKETMESEMDAIKKIEFLESHMQTLVRYKNMYQEESRRLDWNQTMYNKLEGGLNE